MSSFVKKLLRKKIVRENFQDEITLRRCLTAFDLTLLGIGAIIGAGVFVLTGIAAAVKAGPSIVISYLIAGVASTFSALSYAELAASIGGCGSAYGYAYVGFGEFIAWIIGWDLLLEYGMSVSAVAIGWSGYMSDMLKAIGLIVPKFLLKSPFEGGVINLLATLIILFLTLLLAVGIRESSRFNMLMVFLKLLAIGTFLSVAIFHIDVDYWKSFFPFGWIGTLQGAALIFFSYIGFDAVSTAAEEAIHPQRDVPVGIIVSLVICTLIYMLTAALLTGVVPYYVLNVSSPITKVLLYLGHRFAAGMVAVGAVAGLTTVMLVMFYGFTRIFLAIARDGLLPKLLSKINESTRTPLRIIIPSGFFMSLMAGLFPLHGIAELVNIGTLSAFALVCGGSIVLHYTQPTMPRPFKIPFNPLIPICGIIFCIVLIFSLSNHTLWRFVIWMLIGFMVYFSYSRTNSLIDSQ